MSSPVEKRRRYTVEEYFELERTSQEKYEYHDGYIVAVGEAIAMAGGSVNHSLIVANVIRELGNRLKGRPCRVYDSNLRVRIPRKTLYFYPDATVICGPRATDDASPVGETVTNPRVIVEVLSPGTELDDRGEKFARYREMETLQEYVLVAQREARVESFLRQPDGTWSLASTSRPAVTTRIRSLEIDLPLDEIYAGVDFTPDAG